MVVRKLPNKEIVKILSKIILENKNKIRELNNSLSTIDDFNSLTRPGNDFHKDCKLYFKHLCDLENKSLKKVLEILPADRCTNTLIYPPNSFMNWHTNNDIPGKRIYYTYSKAKSIFRYIDPVTKDIIDDYDDIGWTCREFEINPNKSLWHCVWSEGIRFSFGFNRCYN